ncbi:MAG: alpha-glucosidase [Phenylobacterium sp. RIFCSPHIGHO2_01_FULL_69_31]|uniref:alpha-amylase family glycosyl hydrolase n=1 Tax=Phenylobacterium sp. RIFCSPHIGHO2_01_FULL_69_31 TaxID=1801944 RepID=UPI0008C91A8B|nr:alpha-amylase family glycosyl hydrolase [Phenylobacterium sp. RIFCSPHIGHO2_01_FULL_69_31]OHB27451.1 MAG: alpha-glucosidase [Phenylobacterium sp. RIFCSPHIGHO2_01_FULL_69_31]
MTGEPWWKGAILYHVYVRSFFDSNGDGHGDLPGVMAKLDYIQSLGVDGLWLSPIHPSPNRDWGYDIADFEGIQADYGTPEDFQRLLDAAHGRGLKVVLDEVLSHTSDVHPWFVESLTGGRDGPKADWYVWADPQEDGTAPNNWLSVFGGPAWAYQPARRQHYHHKFLRQQPKLNWRDAGAREAALSVLDFWLGKGVDGFRLDVAGTFLHDAALTPNPPVPMAERRGYHWSHAGNLQLHWYDSNLEENVETLDVIRRRVEAHDGRGGGERFVFGEFSEEEARCGAYLSSAQGLHSGYTFVMLLARKLDAGFVTKHFETLAAYPDHWPTISFSNHDVPRTVSRFGGKDASPELAKMLFALLVSLKGTTLIYQGEELGLPQAALTRDQLRDPVGDLYWPYDGGRDGCRTPMPWTAGPQMGFTEGEPWLPLAAEHRGLSVEEQGEDPDSALSFSREMIALRRATPALRLGAITFVATADPVVAFVRRHAGDEVVCVFNFGRDPQVFAHPSLERAELLPLRAGEADLRGGSVGLSPYAACFLRLI